MLDYPQQVKNTAGHTGTDADFKSAYRFNATPFWP